MCSNIANPQGVVPLHADMRTNSRYKLSGFYGEQRLDILRINTDFGGDLQTSRQYEITIELLLVRSGDQSTT